MVNFDNLGGKTSVLKFHVFISLSCEASVRFRLISGELVRLLSDVKIWYSIFTNVKNRCQNPHTCEELVLIFTNVKNRYQILTHVKIGTKCSQM